MDDNGAILKRACDLILGNPVLQPVYDKSGKFLESFCNCGLRDGAQAIGCHEFDDPSLNMEAMIAIARGNASGRWHRGDGTEATIHALSGGFAFANMTAKELGEAHAHGAIVYPVGRQHSAALGRDVPMVANVGVGNPDAPLAMMPSRPGFKTRPNWLCSVAWAFPCKRLGREPDYMLFS